MAESGASLQAIYRYPVKGLSPEPLARLRLDPGRTLPFDRRYAIENGPSGFDPAAPAYLPKQRFLMLMRNARLARLRTRFDDRTGVLSIVENGQAAVEGDLGNPEGRQAIEAFFARFCADELRGAPKILQAEDHSFSDVAKKVVSIINLASVAALETVLGRRLDPLRFRANLYVTGWPAWHEFELVGRTLRIGAGAELKPVKRIVRCAATEVDPQTGDRDAAIPQALVQAYGHCDCGVYAEVLAGGDVAVGDAVVERR